MNVLGDVLDAILKPLDFGRRHVIMENSDSPNNEKTLFRPWADILAVNKSKWTAKHDAGNNIRPIHINPFNSRLIIPPDLEKRLKMVQLQSSVLFTSYSF